MLSDRSIFVRLHAAGAVGKLGGNPETFVPVLLQCFHEGDSGTRSYALDFLSKLKERARSAVPDLIYSLAAATNSNDHYSLLSALREIDSEQAAKFELPRPVSPSEPPPEEPAANPDQLIAPDKP
jgi:HEAT repeat protein